MRKTTILEPPIAGMLYLRIGTRCRSGPCIVKVNFFDAVGFSVQFPPNIGVRGLRECIVGRPKTNVPVLCSWAVTDQTAAEVHGCINSIGPVFVLLDIELCITSYQVGASYVQCEA